MRHLILASAIVSCCFMEVSGKTSVVIETWDTHFYLYSPNNLVSKEYKKFRVLNEQGYGMAVFQDYYDEFKKITAFHYTITDANGRKVKKFSKFDAQDLMLNPSYEIGDARILVLDPQYRDFPFTVEIEVEATYNGFLNFPLWNPRYTHDLEVQNADLTLECYHNFDYSSRELNGVDAPEIADNGKVKTIHWSVKNLPALDKHRSYKSFYASQPKVHLTPLTFSLKKTSGDFSSWTNFGEWYRNLNEGRNELGAASKKFLDGLSKEYGSNAAIISKIVYQYVQSRTRYISVQLGIGGFQTIPADEVERTGYGDCKALTNYMKAMLDYLKIPSNPVLVKAGDDEPDILFDFPSNQFNHVFLGVPMQADTLWFECTSQTLPPAYLGTFTDDRHALWIEKNKSRIIHTPSFEASESIMRNDCVVNLQPGGEAQVDLTVTETGMFFDDVMYYQNLPQDRIKAINYSKFPYKDFSIQAFNFSVPDKNSPLFRLHYKVQVNGLGKALGTKIIVPSNVLLPIEKFLEMDFTSKKNEVRRPYTIEDHVRILIPENYRAAVLPKSVTENSEFGSFEMGFQEEKDGLHIYRKAIMNKGNYQKDDFDRFYEFVKKIKAAEQAKIVLESKT